MKVAISQSNYIPWKGYFDQIGLVDQFVIYDCVQYTRRDWRNRNLIKTPTGKQWITIPTKTKGNYFSLIQDIEIDGYKWRKDHLDSICRNYKKSKYFEEVKNLLMPIIMERKISKLSTINVTLIKAICKYLSINTIIRDSSCYEMVEGRTENLLNICIQCNANEYISGPAAKNYLDEDLFKQKGIKLTYMNHDNYPKYDQLWGDYIERLSIVDLLFNYGKNSIKFIGNDF